MLQPEKLAPIRWVSPLGEDDYAEYRDAAFLERLGQSALVDELKAFWPGRGPQWDALGLADGMPVLVEAKAHIREFLTPASSAGSESLARIQAALSVVKRDLNVDETVDWAQRFYQYSNRLAHLWWFHNHGVRANLLFVSFLNDRVMKGPTDRETWNAAFDVAAYAMGLPTNHRLSRYIHHVWPDVSHL